MSVSAPITLRTGLEQVERSLALATHAFALLTYFATHRYLMSCTSGRLCGAEKAQRHQEITIALLALILQIAPDDVRCSHEDLYAFVHSSTQELTDNLDTMIGFPIGDQHPDYDALAPKFAKHFFAIAIAELRKLDSKDYA